MFKKSDYYHKGKRKNEFLRLYLNPEPKTKAEKDVNKKTRELAETIRAQRQIEMQNGTFGFHDIEKLKGSFTTYLLKLSEDRNTSDGNYGNWDSMIKHFKTFAPYDVSFQDLDRKLVENFRTYLDSKAESKSKKKLSQNSKYSYFNKGKKLLEDAIKKEPNNIEIRLMRLISQEKTPSFLGYNKNIEADRNFIIKNYKNSDDENLVKFIKNYLKI